jgi:hypothetical protein
MYSSCQIICTFVVGGGKNSTPTRLLQEDPSHPLTLESVPILPRFPDSNDKDVTILNIQENRNEGMMNVDLAQAMAGHDDHDATAMADLGAAARRYPTVALRWIQRGKRSHFWEHPVRTKPMWERVMKRERRTKIRLAKQTERAEQQPSPQRCQ